jgi:hypothetical protein
MIVKRVNKKQTEYVTPDVEVSVRSGEQELAAIAFYATGTGEWDVLVGVAHPSSRNNIAAALRYAADACEAAAFPLGSPAGDEGDSNFERKVADFPF